MIFIDKDLLLSYEGENILSTHIWLNKIDFINVLT